MKSLFFSILLVACALALAGCASPSATSSAATPPASPRPAPENTPAGTATPLPPTPTESAAPALATPGASATPAPPAGVQNTPENHAAVFIDSSSLEGQKGAETVSLLIAGSLPSPCHQFHALVKPPDGQGRIDVSVYSLVDSEKVCAQVLTEFQEKVEIAHLSQGKYTLYLNNKQVAEFKIPYVQP